MKLDYKKTFLIGFGFFATSIWVIYNTYMPLFLDPLVQDWKIGSWGIKSLAVGAIMTLDNIFGVIFQPLFGSISDRTKTRFGKRMPIILIGIPVCAVLFALIPTMSGTLLLLMPTVILLNFGMSTWRSPVVALMPDLTPAPLRSKANGVINMMGGIGGLIAFFAGGQLFKAFSYNGPFLLGSAVMIGAVLVLFFCVREPALPAAPAPENRPEVKKEKLDLSRGERRSLILLLFAIFFWFTGYNAIESFFSLYATKMLVDPATHLPLTGGQASILLGVFTVSLIVAAIPAGFLGARIGRRRAILIGLVGVTAMFVPMFFLRDLAVLRVLLFVSGVFWAFVNINSLPMVVEMAGVKHIGAFTGYYYTFSCSSAILSPILFGAIMTTTHDYYPLMFLYAAAAFVLAIGCIAFVRHGESAPQKLSSGEAVGERL